MKNLLVPFAFVVAAATTSYSVQAAGVTYVKPYYKPSTGGWVSGHYRSKPDGYCWNNLNGC
jgi:hypothetical protein